ncbi:MAG TPA: D-alanyl-D-alanine carboxypeptidase [Clostridiaceae bacterium]|jgi:D-alanyl-D-alanine carboxypeptidase|nr:D-alanyl-D-alanine carboxypeptidase [Clostridiaceae bacterium]HBF76660.1 D-alanyl-D-alanine carboxypeptidase [Clostridiaceae bacterium]HBG38156.1 D-alanyl-D-alanine carboxypeptidase [Clostridiaceae bacterium]HBN29400.1 D-alanyl-D-alanine carboxypeptidase [Clostridiaceae bacterium]HBX48233.1 D-alanyl-D-alanine carboxypeptidase [Clostridiaceae bacterium]
MKKLLIYLTLMSLILCNKAEAAPINPKLNCSAAVLIDQNSGRILYGKNSDKKLAMASTTKIITAIVAIEKGDLGEKVCVSKKAVSVSGSTVGLKEGEKITLEELLYGLMLCSGNDAAIAIAEHIGGSADNFVALMNDKALKMGAYNTSFKTPHGLDADMHFTTAEDLAFITAYAMKNETFSRIVSTKEISNGITGKFNRKYANINKFLYRIEDADGVKTGYTGNAGKCLVASIKHPYGRYICVVLNSANRWNDAASLMKYAKENYSFIKIMGRDESLKQLRVYGGDKRYLNAKINDDLYIPVKEDEVNNLKVDAFIPSAMFSPIEEDEIIGNIVVFINDVQIAKYPVYSDKKILRKNFVKPLKN